MASPVLRKMARAVIDNRTTVICLHVAGQIVEVDEPYETLLGEQDEPPFHIHCRTVETPWLPGMINDMRAISNEELQRRPMSQRRIGPDGPEGRMPPKARPPEPETGPVAPVDMSFEEMTKYRMGLSPREWEENAQVQDDWFGSRFETERPFKAAVGDIGLSEANDRIRDLYVEDDDGTLAMLRQMREGAPMTAKMRKIEGMIEESTVIRPTTTYRGAVLSDDIVDRLVPNARWSDAAFQSTDLTEGQAVWYAGERARTGAQGRTVLFEYQLSPGTEARYVGDGEVVVQRNTDFTVDRVDDEGDLLRVILRRL